MKAKFTVMQLNMMHKQVDASFAAKTFDSYETAESYISDLLKHFDTEFEIRKTFVKGDK